MRVAHKKKKFCNFKWLKNPLDLKQFLNNALIFLLCLQLIFSPSLSLAETTPKHSLIPPPQEVFNFDLENAIADYSENPDHYQFTEEQESQLREMVDAPAKIRLEIMFLWNGLNKTITKQLKTKTLDEIHSNIIKRQRMTSVTYEIKGVGKAELTTLGTDLESPFIYKIRHNKLKIPIIISSSQYSGLSDAEGDPPQNLSPEELKEEIKLRKVYSKEWRKLIVNFLKAEFSEQNEYLPLPQALQEKERKEKMTEGELRQYISSLSKDSGKALESQDWYQKTVSKLQNWYQASISELDLDKKSNTYSEMLILFINPHTQKVQGLRNPKKPKIGSFEHLRMLFDYYYEPPSIDKGLWDRSGIMGKTVAVTFTGDYFLGWLMGSILGFTSWATAMAVPSHSMPGLTPMEIAVNTFIWTAAFAIGGKPIFNKLLFSGTEKAKYYKNQVIGFSHSLTLMGLSDLSLNPINDDLSLDPVAREAYMNITINQAIKNHSKAYLQAIPQNRDKMGESSGNLLIPYPSRIQFFHKNEDGSHSFMRIEKKYHDTFISRSNFEKQSVQFVTTPISLASRLGMLTVSGVPMSHFIYLALGPISQKLYLVYKKWYLEKVYLPRISQRFQSAGKKYYKNLDPEYERLKSDLESENSRWNSLKLSYNKPVLFAYAISKFAYAYLLKSGEKLFQNLPGFSIYFAKELYDDYTPFDALIQRKLDSAKLSFERFREAPTKRIPYTQFLGFYLRATGEILWEIPKFFLKNIVQAEYQSRQKLMENLEAENLLYENIFRNEELRKELNPTFPPKNLSCSVLFH